MLLLLLKWLKADFGADDLYSDRDARAMVEGMMRQILKPHGNQKSEYHSELGQMASAFLKVCD